MSFHWKQDGYFKLDKCRSLATFHQDSKISEASNTAPSRPKLESIRSKKTEIGNQNIQQNYESVRTMGRVKSVDQLSKIKQAISLENMLEVYKKENENLKQQNKFLIKQVKKRQKNQQVLTNYIQQLRKQIKTLQRNPTSTSPLTPRSKIVSTFSSAKSSQPQTERTFFCETKASKVMKTLQQGETWSTANEIQQLNQRFNVLMQQCSKQSCKKTRNLLRGKLAQTAERMKNFKKQFNMIQ